MRARLMVPFAALIFVVLGILDISRCVRASDLDPANSISILVKAMVGAPTPEEIVNYYSAPTELRSGKPPLGSLAFGDPQQVVYLLPIRATGDFLTRLQATPNSTRSQLERYIVATYPTSPTGANYGSALAALQADPYVEAAYSTPRSSFSSDYAEDEQNFGIDEVTSSQYGRDNLNVDVAWQLAGGYSQISVIDTGLYTNHPGLEQFSSAGEYLGGNFIPIASLDISLNGLVNPPQNDSNVDERRPMPVPQAACNADPVNHPNLPPFNAGHGTHVAGLVAANGSGQLDVKGICKNCGIAMWKAAYVLCDAVHHRASLGVNTSALYAALALTGDGGSQVANMSFGFQDPNAGQTPFRDYCERYSDSPTCLAIRHNTYRDVVMVASSGNARTYLDVPAAESAVVSAGGFQQNLAIWDLSPGGTTNCPSGYGIYLGQECGSNYSKLIGSVYPYKQEVVASAQSVLSTTYPGYNWNSDVKCGDQFPGPGFGNGAGWCTGTSMSAPQISGIVGILRSVNPLVHGGDTPNALGTIRNVLARTTRQQQAGQPWTPTLGYGIPDAAAAVRYMLGTAQGVTMRNRVTPLFRLYSAVTHDYVDTTVPQTAIAFIINRANAWKPPASLPIVPNYPSFPYDPADETPLLPTIPAPRASVYVLTTEVQPRGLWPRLVPLYLLDKVTGSHDEYTLATTTDDVEYLHNHGYNLRTIQGYVYQPCTPEPSCIPPGAQKFYRAYNANYSDSATFLQSEASTFAAAGYNSTYPPSGGTSKLLGYAYPATDTDHDGLPDGFEYVVGTDPTRADTDGDGIADAAEYPMVGTPVSDPCAGGAYGATYCDPDIFGGGFDRHLTLQ